MIQKKFEITLENNGQRIDALSAKFFPSVSRSQWLNYGVFICNSIAKKPKTKTKLGQKWEINYTPVDTSEDEHLKPWDYKLDILQESDSWAVINKPIGISVHPSNTEKSQETIVNALLSYYKNNLSENFDIIEEKKVERPGLVHRLDKTTSGVLLIAKNNKTHKILQENWKNVEKTYYAVVDGTPPEKGEIESGIVRDPNKRHKMMAANNEKSKWAITHFKTVERFNGRALLEIKILTGRTHQIRVHLSSIGYPILGDTLYAGEPADRIYLHAAKLRFPDPENLSENVSVSATCPFELQDIKIPLKV